MNPKKNMSHSSAGSRSIAGKKTLFSGIQPTGQLHIGNYLGALKHWVEIQNDYNSIFCIVDYHSISEDYEPKNKQQQIFNTAVDFLAAGIDPNKSIVFVQSHVPECTELAWVFNCITPVSELERMTQYKDKSLRQKHNINMGLFDYPALMAADILLYKGEVVPVGEDQQQHVELTRIIARKFNNKFGKYFPEPEVKLNKAARVKSLVNPNRKMDKSLPKSAIFLSDSAKQVQDKIKSAVSGDEGGKNLVDLFTQFSDDQKLIKKFQNEYTSGKIKYAEFKPALAKAIIKTFKPIQSKREKLLKDKKHIQKILADGAKQAQKIATKNMAEIKKLIGI